MTHPDKDYAQSHVNDIERVSIDHDGVIHTPYGSYHPVTGEGLPIDAPEELMRDIEAALVRDGEDSGPPQPLDWDAFLAEMRSDRE